MSITNLITTIQRNGVVLMDGALGTELERRNVPVEGSGWSAFAVRDYPNIIRDIHLDYIQAGSKLHIVNSFSLAPHVLESIGLGHEFAKLNRRVVELFDDAVSLADVDRNNLWAAGSLSTFAAHSDRSLLPNTSILEQNYRNQAKILFEAGVDLFALEMLFDCEISKAMLNAVKEFNLPVILGFTCNWATPQSSEVVTALRIGKSPVPLVEILPEVINSIENTDAIFSIMHSDFDVTDAALDILRKCWDGPIAVYPNSGKFVNLQMQFDSVCEVQEFEQAAIRWINAGVQIVGGCCGIGPDHIEAMSRELRRI